MSMSETAVTSAHPSPITLPIANHGGHITWSVGMAVIALVWYVAVLVVSAVGSIQLCGISPS